MPTLVGLPLYYFLFGFLAVGGMYWVVCNALKNDDAMTGLLCFLFAPYAIYYGFKRFDQNKIPLALFFAGFAGCIVTLVTTSTIPKEIVHAAHALTTYDLIGIAGMIIAWLASIWVTFNAFQRDGVMAGLFCLACGPYLLYYGVKNFAANRIPMSVLIFGACLIELGIALGRGLRHA